MNTNYKTSANNDRKLSREPVIHFNTGINYVGDPLDPTKEDPDKIDPTRKEDPGKIDPTRKEDPSRNDPTRIDEPGKVDPTRREDPTRTPEPIKTDPVSNIRF